MVLSIQRDVNHCVQVASWRLISPATSPATETYRVGICVVARDADRKSLPVIFPRHYSCCSHVNTLRTAPHPFAPLTRGAMVASSGASASKRNQPSGSGSLRRRT